MTSGISSFSSMPANPLATVMRSLCVCCIECGDKYLSYPTKAVFNEVAMNARSFRTGAVAARDTVLFGKTAFRTLHGTTWMFQTVGLVLIGTLGGILTFDLRKNEKAMSEGDLEQYQIIKFCLLVLGGVLAAIIATPFMLVLGGVSDTILYCREVESRRESKEPLEEGYSITDLGHCMCIRNKPVVE